MVFVQYQHQYLKLPTCLAEHIHAIADAVDGHGEQNTAPELVALIEAFFHYLGALWLSEYVHAGAFDEKLNRLLFGSLKRSLFTGQWVMLSRWIRSLFLERSISTVFENLSAIDFGEPESREHPVTILTTYRNQFCHGSFSLTAEAIRQNHELMEQLMLKLPGLIHQAPMFLLEDGTALLANGAFEPADTGQGVDEPPLQPFILGIDGRTVLHLYPLLYVSIGPEDGLLTLNFGKAKHPEHPVTGLLDREELRIYLDKYSRERSGFIPFPRKIKARARGKIPEETASQLKEALAEKDWNLFVIETHPGCGAAHIIASLENYAKGNRYSSVASYMVEPDDLSHSGIVFANFILRQTETVLGLAEEAYKGADSNVLDLLGTAKSDLAQAGKKILVGILDLHHGLYHYPGEDLTVFNVYRSLGDGPIRIVSTVLSEHPCFLVRRLISDKRFFLPVPAPEW